MCKNKNRVEVVKRIGVLCRGTSGGALLPVFLKHAVREAGKVMNIQSCMRVVVLLFVLMMGVNGYSQQQPASATPIRFDPSFWKEELRLNGSQYLRMQEINKEFYDNLVSAFKEKNEDRTAFLSAFAQCWVNRNTRLWDTMNARQQKKWKKISVAEQQEQEINKVTSLYEIE